ncbi:MAG: TorF family putative porin [bacterium]
MPGMARAAAPDVFTGDLQYMTNYIGRGLAQSVGQPSVSGELDYSPRDGVYGGIDFTSINWINELYPGDSVSVEVDGWAGYRRHFGDDWTSKLGVLRLQFPGHYAVQTPPVAEPNTTEAFAYLGWKTWSVQLNYAVTESFGTPDSKGSWYLDLSDKQPLDDVLSLTAHLGHKHETGTDAASGMPHSLNDYTDYKLALVWAVTGSVQLTLAHTWTNADPARYTLDGYDVRGHHTWLMLEKDF